LHRSSRAPQNRQVPPRGRGRQRRPPNDAQPPATSLPRRSIAPLYALRGCASKTTRISRQLEYYGARREPLKLTVPTRAPESVGPETACTERGGVLTGRAPPRSRPRAGNVAVAPRAGCAAALQVEGLDIFAVDDRGGRRPCRRGGRDPNANVFFAWATRSSAADDNGASTPSVFACTASGPSHPGGQGRVPVESCNAVAGGGSAGAAVAPALSPGATVYPYGAQSQMPPFASCARHCLQRRGACGPGNEEAPLRVITCRVGRRSAGASSAQWPPRRRLGSGGAPARTAGLNGILSPNGTLAPWAAPSSSRRGCDVAPRVLPPAPSFRASVTSVRRRVLCSFTRLPAVANAMTSAPRPPWATPPACASRRQRCRTAFAVAPRARRVSTPAAPRNTSSRYKCLRRAASKNRRPAANPGPARSGAARGTGSAKPLLAAAQPPGKPVANRRVAAAGGRGGLRRQSPSRSGGPERAWRGPSALRSLVALLTPPHQTYNQ